MPTEFQFTALTMADGYTPSVDQDVATKAYVDGVAGSAPTGSIIAFGGASAPAGWLLCDGASYLQGDHAALFGVIGTAFGSADGTHFNVPDLRGRFLRGQDDGAGRDPDAGSRTAMNPGGNDGDNIGSVQVDSLQNITGSFNANRLYLDNPTTTGAMHADPNNTKTLRPGDTAAATINGIGFDASLVARTSTETRPVNAYVNFIIKT